MASAGATLFIFVLVLSFVGLFALAVFISRETSSTTVTDRADAQRRARRDTRDRSAPAATDGDDETSDPGL